MERKLQNVLFFWIICTKSNGLVTPLMMYKAASRAEFIFKDSANALSNSSGIIPTGILIARFQFLC